MVDMWIKIYSYDGEETTIILKEELIDCLLISIVSGDEQLTVVYTDGNVEVFDSCHTRYADYYDGIYCIYNGVIDFTNYEEFRNSRDPLERMGAVLNLLKEYENECKEG